MGIICLAPVAHGSPSPCLAIFMDKWEKPSRPNCIKAYSPYQPSHSSYLFFLTHFLSDWALKPEIFFAWASFFENLFQRFTTSWEELIARNPFLDLPLNILVPHNNSGSALSVAIWKNRGDPELL